MVQTAKQSESSDWEVEYPSLGLKLNCVLNVEKENITRNIEENAKRKHERIWAWKQQDTEVVICAGGPSLKDHLDEIKEKQKEGAKIVALANVAHILKKAGIQFNAHMLLDAKPRNAEFITDIETTYFIASQCDPKVFENAEKTGNKIYLYHAVNNQEEFDVITESEGPWIPVQGGSTIAMRAIRLFTLLGYKNFHVYGWDSCFLDGDHHAYEQPDADKQKVFKFEFEDRVFEVTPWMVGQAMEFQQFIKMFCMNINMQVHGNGLISYIIEKAANLNVNIEEK